MLDRRYKKVKVDGKLIMGKGASIVATSSAGVETTLDMTELAALNDIAAADLAKIDGITNGTAAANKAVVLDASKGISTITSATVTTLTSTTVNATNFDAGASGTAGTVDVFPTTASKGKLALTCADQTGNTTVTVNANAMGQATQVNIPDPGAAASYVVQSTAAVTLAEADVLDGATAGTAVASKALVVDASKNITALGSVLSTAPTGGGIGYATGAGGAVTQITNRSTGVTINKLTGTITGDATSLAGLAEAEFVVTNSTVALRDTVVLSLVSGPTANTSQVSVSAVAAGSFTIKIRNMHATAADTGAPIINFAVFKAVNA